MICPYGGTTYEPGLFACRNCGEDAVTHTRSDETIYDVLVLWWRRNVVGPDPDPRYSYLDRLDGMTNRKVR